MRVLSVETPTHSRILVEDAADSSSSRLLVAFHGYGQNAQDMLDDVSRIPGVSAWTVASVQALHRFYNRGDQSVVASWMTREDRDLAIADNLQYIDRVIDRLGGREVKTLVFVGFSQGVAMAYRAALLGRSRVAGVIALAGDIPPELKAATTSAESAGSDALHPSRWPPVLIGVGVREEWYGPARLAADVAFLRAQGVAHDVVHFDGGHEWTNEFREKAGEWLARL
jgi:predicted esterase